jgi:hypothetical protein
VDRRIESVPRPLFRRHPPLPRIEESPRPKQQAGQVTIWDLASGNASIGIGQEAQILLHPTQLARTHSRTKAISGSPSRAKSRLRTVNKAFYDSGRRLTPNKKSRTPLGILHNFGQVFDSSPAPRSRTKRNRGPNSLRHQHGSEYVSIPALA